MISYNEAIDVLRKAGVVLTSDHLSYLADAIYKKPVIAHNYPKEAKPFYVCMNDVETVAASVRPMAKMTACVWGDGLVDACLWGLLTVAQLCMLFLGVEVFKNLCWWEQ